MRKMVISSFLILLVLSFFTLNVFAQDKVFQYEGAKNCKMCHSSKKSGEAYKIWAKSSHANAYATLASEESKAIAEKMDIEDPQKSDQCLSCHVTGHGKEASFYKKGYAMDQGVSCEACHGAGNEYNDMKVMKQITAGEVKGADYGLTDPDEANCVTCHNEKSPTFKGFEYKEYVSKIVHPIPEK